MGTNQSYKISSDIPDVESIRNTILLYSIILVVGSTLAYDLFFLLYNFSLFLNFSLVITSILTLQIFSFWFYRKKKHTTSKVFFLSGVILTISSSTFFFLGSDSGMHMVFIFTMVFPFFVWGQRDRFYGIVFAIISLFLFIYFEFFAETTNTLVDLSDNMKHYLTISIIITSILCLSLVLIIYQVIAEKNEIRVNAQSEELKEFIRELTLKKDELHRINVSKNKLFSVVAHDLKAPFNTILGFSDILVNQWKTLNEDEKFKYSKLILDSSETTYGLLENLLAWSRMQTKGILCKPENVNLYKTIERVLLVYKNGSEDKNISIINNLSDDHHIYADNYMISTVFRNFLSNAIKFTPKNGTITISAAPAGKSVIKISISDTGVGMNSDQIESIFSLEKNTSTVGTANELGTGLGLPLCKDMVEQNNGNIDVESKPGAGSTFTVSLRTTA